MSFRAPTTIARQQVLAEKSLREEYADFVEGCKRDLDPIEAEFGGIASFEEWALAQRNQETGFEEMKSYA